MATEPWITDWLSDARFATYLRHAGNDPRRALAIYEWNTQVNAAIMHDIAHLEVGLRNKIDRALTPATHADDEHWTNHLTMTTVLFHEETPANERMIKDVTEARQRLMHPAARKRQEPTPDRMPGGKVLAELSFGFWPYLFTRARHDTIWGNYLQDQFPNSTDRNKLHQGLLEINHARNRAAHHEPVKRAEISRIRNSILRYARYVSTDLREYMEKNSEIQPLAQSRP